MSKLPYANDRQLGRIASLVRVMEICGYSPSEQERPVLLEGEQRRLDAATRCSWSVTDAITLKFCITEVLLGSGAGKSGL